MGRVADQLLLFYGDAEQFRDEETLDEQMLALPVSGGRPVHRLVLKATSMRDNLGEVHWTSDHVRSVLPGSTMQRLLLLTSLGNVAAVSPSEVSELAALALGGLYRQDLREEYMTIVATRDVDGNLTRSPDDVVISIEHPRTKSEFAYRVPWRLASPPKLVAIVPSGRHVAVGDLGGHFAILSLPR
jgi:hypothetical protein